MVSILGLCGYFSILAKAQTVSFATVAISGSMCASLKPFIHDLNLHVPISLCPFRNDSNKLGMVLTPVTPTFRRQRQEALELQASLKYRLRPSGGRANKRPIILPELHESFQNRDGERYSNTQMQAEIILLSSMFSIAFHQPHKQALLGYSPM